MDGRRGRESCVWVLEISVWGVKYGSHKKVGIFKWCELKKCVKRVGIGNWGILSDEWWVIVFKKPNIPLVTVCSFLLLFTLCSLLWTLYIFPGIHFSIIFFSYLSRKKESLRVCLVGRVENWEDRKWGNDWKVGG